MCGAIARLRPLPPFVRSHWRVGAPIGRLRHTAPATERLQQRLSEFDASSAQGYHDFRWNRSRETFRRSGRMKHDHDDPAD